MKFLGEVLSLSTEYLKSKTVSRPRLIAEMILAHALRIGRMDLYMRFECPLEESELQWVREALKRAASLEPIEYILSEVDFYRCLLTVTPAVLIPRSETEILVDLAVAKIKEKGSEGKVLWDLCAGSGCMGISMKKACPDLSVYLSDFSEEALALCGENAKKNAVEVTLKWGDLLTPFQGMKADYIVCNPPYIKRGDYETLDRSVRDYEPKMALIGGESGFEFYEKLAGSLKEHLHSGAIVCLEIGQEQGEGVSKIFSDPYWKKKELRQDWSGKDRFFFLEME